MGSFDSQWLKEMLMLLPPLFFSLTLHEYAHARVALAFGDPTARNMGRVSLNPLRHLDPVGTLMILFSRVIGWAKPVPVNPLNLHPRRLGDIAVSIAGPLTNLALAVVCGLTLRWAGPTMVDRAFDNPGGAWELATIMLRQTTTANLAMCFFNLLPLFPLDGHHIVRELLPTETQRGFMQWQIRFGAPLLLVLLIGPRLLTILTHGSTLINPLGTYLRYVISPVRSLLTGGLF